MDVRAGVACTTRSVLWGLVGMLSASPAGVAWYFEWNAKYPGDVAWGFWAMIASGAIGGATFGSVGRLSGLTVRARKLIRLASGLMVVGPSVVLMLDFVVFLVSLRCSF